MVPVHSTIEATCQTDPRASHSWTRRRDFSRITKGGLGKEGKRSIYIDSLSFPFSSCSFCVLSHKKIYLTSSTIPLKIDNTYRDGIGVALVFAPVDDVTCTILSEGTQTVFRRALTLFGNSLPSTEQASSSECKHEAFTASQPRMFSPCL